MQRFHHQRTMRTYTHALIGALLCTFYLPLAAYSLDSVRVNPRITANNMVRLTVRTQVTHTRLVGVKISRSSQPNDIRVVRRARKSSRRFTLVDGPLAAGTYYYRVRLSGNLRSKWSPVQSVSVNDSSIPSDSSPNTPPTTTNPTNPATIPLPNGLSECASGVSETIISRSNEHRLAAGLSLLGSNDLLNTAARIHSISMALSQTMSHDGWFDEIWNIAGFHGSHVGQNVASYITDPVALVDAWMGSPGHRNNILKPVYTYIGVSCVKDANGVHWWTQDFGG